MLSERSMSLKTTTLSHCDRKPLLYQTRRHYISSLHYLLRFSKVNVKFYPFFTADKEETFKNKLTDYSVSM